MQIPPHDPVDQMPEAAPAVAVAPPATGLPTNRSQTLEARMIAGVLFLCSAAVIGLSCYLHADPRGLGTHEELGLPPCSFYQTTGLPCPTCGMTTSFTLAAHGHLIEAFLNQPAGAVLALINAMVMLVCAYAMVFGLSLAPLAQVVFRPTTFWLLGALILLAWGYKVLLTLKVIP